MEKSFNFSFCFYVIRHAISRYCLIWSYICNKVCDAKRHDKMWKLKCSFPDVDPSIAFLLHSYLVSTVPRLVSWHCGMLGVRGAYAAASEMAAAVSRVCPQVQPPHNNTPSSLCVKLPRNFGGAWPEQSKVVAIVWGLSKVFWLNSLGKSKGADPRSRSP